VLVNNAGIGTYGRFWEVSSAEDAQSVQLNVNALVHLTHLVLPGMVAWKKGTVINVSSMAGFQPVPYFATYAATKSFVLHFSEAIDAELRGNGYRNVRVVALAPGPMETGFQGRAGVTKEEYGAVPWENVDKVAQQAVDAIGRGPAALITGLGTKILVFLNRFTPRSIVTAFGERLTRPRQEREGVKV
jgi:short-subunit dehydrogenase